MFFIYLLMYGLALIENKDFSGYGRRGTTKIKWKEREREREKINDVTEHSCQ
jgi:hypothetical protein